MLTNSQTQAITRLSLENYKNLNLTQGIQLNQLNILIGPNGSGKSNLLNVLRFLKNTVAFQFDGTKGNTGFDEAIFELGGNNILDATVSAPASVRFGFEFPPLDGPIGPKLEIELLIQAALKKTIIKQELLRSARAKPGESEPFYFYRCHDRASGEGVVSVSGDAGAIAPSHYLKLEDVPVNELALISITRLLESSQYPPERMRVYATRRKLIENITQWHFYNANEMNLKEIRQAAPQIGPSDKFLSARGDNLPIVLDNLIQESRDFEERLNQAMNHILPTTLRVRATHSRLSLAIEWHTTQALRPFYLDEMSDGTVRMLCWATILHSPYLPSLLVIEEPELGVHVAWLPVLAEWIKQAADKTQVIISTHSPDLLDHFTDKLENVLVFRATGADKGHFILQPLESAQFVKPLADGWQLGDLYRVGDPAVGGWPW